MLGLALSLAIPLLPGGPGDSTPGGVHDVILMENSGGILMETGDFILLEA